MNINTNGFPQAQGGQQQFLTPAMLQTLQSQGQNVQFQKNIINPALLNPQMVQQQQGLAMNPQQLLNGRGMSAMAQQQLAQSLNPAMLLQMQAGNAMQANIGEGMNGVNQAALNMSGMGNMVNASVAGVGSMNANTMGFNPQHLAQLQQQMASQQIDPRQMQAKLSVSKIVSDVLAITNSIFSPPNLLPSDRQQQHRVLQQQRQMGQMTQGQPQFDQRQQMQQRFLQDQSQFNAGQPNGLQGVLAQQQSMHSTPNFFERPSSTSSVTHSQQFQQSPQAQQFPQQNSQFQMMPPPPPRPPSSRPGTSQSQISHHSGAPAGIAPSSPALGTVGQLGGMQRPPSRPRTSSGFSIFGQGQPIGTPKPPTPIQPSLPLQQQQQQPRVNTPTHVFSPFPQHQLHLQPQQQPTPPQHQHQQPQVQTPQGFTQVPSTPVPGSPGRKRRLTGQSILDPQPSPQFGGIGGSGLTGISMNNPGNVSAGGLMPMAQSMGSPNPTLLGGAGGGLMGPPHVVPSRVNSLGGQVHQLPQGLDDPGLFAHQLTAPQTSLPSQGPQTPIAGGTAPFQTPSGVPNVGISPAGMRQRQAVLGTPGFADVQAPLQSSAVQRMPQTVVTPAQMQMQMQNAGALTINPGLPEVPGLPVVPDATVPGSLPLAHPPTAP